MAVHLEEQPKEGDGEVATPDTDAEHGARAAAGAEMLRAKPTIPQPPDIVFRPGTYTLALTPTSFTTTGMSVLNAGMMSRAGTTAKHAPSKSRAIRMNTLASATSSSLTWGIGPEPRMTKAGKTLLPLNPTAEQKE